MTYRTPLYEAVRREGGAMVVTFDQPIHATFGGRAKIEGFALAGEGRHFFPAEARMARSSEVTVSSPFVTESVAVRYAWATHPRGTLVGAGSNGLPAAPFRTDDWPWPDAPFAPRGSQEDGEYRRWIDHQRKLAQAQAADRRQREAEKVLDSENLERH